MNILKNKNITLYIFIAIFIIKGLLYAYFIVPRVPGSSPDDIGHISYVQYMAETKKLPVLFETPMEKNMSDWWKSQENETSHIADRTEFSVGDKNWIAQHPPLYYLYVLPSYMIADIFTNDLGMLIFAMRAMTVILGALTLFFIYKALDLMGFNDIAKNCVMICFTFSSAIQFYFSVVTNDSMVIFLSTLSLYLFLKYLYEDKKIYFYVFAAACAGIVITKYTGGILLPVYAVFYIYKKFKINNIKDFIKTSLIGALIFAIIISPVLIRNICLYGDMFKVAGENSVNNDTTLFEYLTSKGYFNEIIPNIINLVGWNKMIYCSGAIKLVFAFFIYFSYILSVNHCCKNYFLKIIVFLIPILGMFLIPKSFARYEIKLMMISYIFTVLITFFSQREKNQRDNMLLCSLLMLITAVVFFKVHYANYLDRGHHGAMHGRYYYIALLPFFIVLFDFVNKYKAKYMKYIPIILMPLMFLIETHFVKMCILEWW